MKPDGTAYFFGEKKFGMSLEIRQLVEDTRSAIKSLDLSVASSCLRKARSSKGLTSTYRRKLAELALQLPDPLLAYKFLEPVVEPSPLEKLVLANAANFLGASSYALNTLQRLPPKTLASRPVEVGQILSTNWRDVESLKWFENGGTSEKPAPVASSSGKRQLLFRCYPLLELDGCREVIAISNWFLENEEKPVLRAFAQTFKAWALALEGEFSSARVILSELQKSGFEHEEAWPGALLCLVAAMTQALADCEKRTLGLHDRAYMRLFKPGMLPEASWLNALFWRGKAQFRLGNSCPEDWMRILTYPTITDHFKNKILAHGVADERMFLTSNRLLSRPTQTRINLASKTMKDRDGKVWKLRKPELLLGYLIAAGPHGVPVFRIFDTLWHDEPWSLSSHSGRLDQLLHKLKGQGVTTRREHLHVYVERAKDVCIEFAPNESMSDADHFLRKVSSLPGGFSRRQLSEICGLSERSANRLIQGWVDEGVVQVLSKGRCTFYKLQTKGSQSQVSL